MPYVEKLAAAEENPDGLTEEQLETFRRRAIPEPGAARGGQVDQRRAPRRAEHSRLHGLYVRARRARRGSAGLTELRVVTYVDMRLLERGRAYQCGSRLYALQNGRFHMLPSTHTFCETTACADHQTHPACAVGMYLPAA